MSKEEILTKIYARSLSEPNGLKLLPTTMFVKAEVEEAMDIYIKPLIEEVAELNKLHKLGLQALIESQNEKQQLQPDLKASKSEANEAVEFAEWCAASEYVLTDFDNKKWLHFNDIEKPMKTTTELYEIFKTLNNK